MIVWTAVVALGLWGARTQAEQLREASALRALQVLKALSVPTGVALANQEIARLDSMVGSLEGASAEGLHLMWVAVIDGDGRVVAHSDPTIFGGALDRDTTRLALASDAPVSRLLEVDGRQVLRASVPLISGLRWGTVVGQVDLSHVEAQVQERVWQVLLISSLVALLIGLVLARLIDRQLLQPLDLIRVMAGDIADGRTETRLAPTGRREMDQLAHSLNEMADRIVRQRQHMEARVANRTKELKRANRALTGLNRQLNDAVEQLDELARTDELTGLLNRRAFLETLDFELRRSNRSAGALSLLLLDVDHFKSYNDTHGHPAGDRLLARVSRVFQGRLRTIDRVARYGGEEFAVILLDTGPDEAVCVGEKLAAEVRCTDFTGAERSQPGGRLTVSVGVATRPAVGCTAAELLEEADRALYLAKDRGRNRVHLVSSEAA